MFFVVVYAGLHVCVLFVKYCVMLYGLLFLCRCVIVWLFSLSLLRCYGFAWFGCAVLNVVVWCVLFGFAVLMCF